MVMRQYVTIAAQGTLIGALIGAVAGLVTSEFRLDGAAGGAVIRAIIGAYMRTRIRAYRDASEKAVRHYTEGTRSASSARNELIDAVRVDKTLASGIRRGAEAERRDN